MKDPHVKNVQILLLKEIDTPLGTMMAGAVPEGICLLEFADRPGLTREITELTRRLNATTREGENPHLYLLSQQLKEYYEGHRHEFTVPLVMSGTAFQMEVWRSLLKIPYGNTRSYMQQAITLGDPKAVRAVAHANGMNPISILVPCHRVIASNGQLTGYGGGLWRKKWLLDLEQGKQQRELIF
jgi:AraC family transcriptional regulator of adaptative response/methylated-DNA-[protein]-cysteine methyltransferase